MKNLHNFFQIFFRLILILFGVLIVLWIIWARFIRERLPRDIPFNLSEIGLYIIIYICLIYLVLLKGLIKPGNSKLDPEVREIILNIIYKPLTLLDAAIKNNKYIFQIYNKILEFTITKLTNWTYRDMKHFYFICYIIPRTILVTTLCFDVFYFHNLQYIYSIILLSILPLLHRYIKYSIKYAQDLYIIELDKYYSKVFILDVDFADLDWELKPNDKHNETLVSIKEYTKIQIQAQMDYAETNIEYQGNPLCRGTLIEEYLFKKYGKKTKYNEEYLKNNERLSDDDYDILKENFYNTMPKILFIERFLLEYSNIDNIFLFDSYEYKILKIKILKILIFGLYLLCWGCILLYSYKSVDNFDLLIEITYKVLYNLISNEPFSDLTL